MKEFVEKLISRLEELKNETESEMNLLLDREYLLPCSMNQIDMEEYRVSTFEDAISIVKQLAAEYNNGWIPCSERLPDDFMSMEYLTTVKGRFYSEINYYCVVNHKWYSNERTTKEVNVLAWQPLPTPFVQK